MKPKKSAPGEMSAATSRPARTPEAQENYMINLAMKLVEKRLPYLPAVVSQPA